MTNTIANISSLYDPDHSPTAADAETLTGGNILLVRDPDDEWQPFVIRMPETSIGDTLVKRVQADHLYYELGHGQPKSYALTNAIPSTAIAEALDGTRWQVGSIDDSLVAVTKDLSGELLNPLQRLRQIESEYEARLRFRCETGELKPAQLTRTEETREDWEGGTHDGTDVPTWGEGLMLQDGVPEGTRISPPLAFGKFAKADSTLIEWDAATGSSSISLDIYVAVTDDGDSPPTTGWEHATNGQPVPGISPGQDLSGKLLWCKQVLFSEDPYMLTPELYSLTITLDGQERTSTGIYGLFVDLLEIDNAFKGQRFEFGHNLESVTITADYSEIKTALVGAGMGEEVDIATGEPLPMTFEAVEWRKTNGDPADKPLGQDWVGDEEARKLYGIPDGNGGMLHRFGVHESDGVTPLGVLQGTWTVLQRQARPQVRVDAKVADLEQVSVIDIETGQPTKLSHGKIRLGNISYILARHKGIRAALDVRVSRLERPLKSPLDTRVTLGDPLPLSSQRMIELEQWQKWADRRRRQLDRGKGPATVTVVYEGESSNPWYARYIVPAGDTLDQHWAAIMALLPDSGGQVVLLEGRYPVSSPLIITRDSVRISGQGSGTVFRVQDGTNIAAVFDVTGDDVQVADLAIDGNKSSADCDAGIKVSANGGKLQGVTCRNISGSGIVVSGGSEITLLGNASTDNGAARIYIESSTDITIEANTCRRNGEHGVSLFHATSCSVIANKCYQSGGAGDGNNTGIFLGESSGNIVQGNTCSGNSWTGITLYQNCSDNTISGNTINDNTGDGISIGDESNGNVVTGNTCSGNRIGVYLAVCSRNSLTGNTITNSVKSGLSLTMSDKNNVQDNRCADNAEFGIRVGSLSSNNFVTNNDLVDNGDGSLQDDGSGTILAPGNRI